MLLGFNDASRMLLGTALVVIDLWETCKMSIRIIIKVVVFAALVPARG